MHRFARLAQNRRDHTAYRSLAFRSRHANNRRRTLGEKLICRRPNFSQRVNMVWRNAWRTNHQINIVQPLRKDVRTSVNDYIISRVFYIILINNQELSARIFAPEILQTRPPFNAISCNRNLHASILPKKVNTPPEQSAYSDTLAGTTLLSVYLLFGRSLYACGESVTIADASLP